MVTKYPNVYYTYDQTDTTQNTGGRKGSLEEAGGVEQHNITEAAPNELKLGKGE